MASCTRLTAAAAGFTSSSSRAGPERATGTRPAIRDSEQLRCPVKYLWSRLLPTRRYHQDEQKVNISGHRAQRSARTAQLAGKRTTAPFTSQFSPANVRGI